MFLNEKIEEINYKIKALENIYINTEEGSSLEADIDCKLNEIEHYINKMEEVLDEINIEKI